MTAARQLAVRPGAPEVWLLDARLAGLDEHGLRAWARALSATADAAHASRSYRHPYALVAWHDGPVGVDIERVEPCDRAFAELICTPAELAECARAPEPDAYLTSLWASKEALSKALGDAVRYEPRRLEAPAVWPEQSAGAWRAQRLSAARGHTAWVCWR